MLMWSILVVVASIVGLGWLSDASAETFSQGAKKCEECHRSETQVWQDTKHAKSFAEVHRKEPVKAILAAVGGEGNMRRNEVCVVCHFTETKAEASERARATSGPSCESCHGASSAWQPLHNDYGGPAVKKADETAEHRAKRIADSVAAGMIRPDMHYEIAENCMGCHGLGRAEVPGETVGKMLGAGHPAPSAFELVAFSQGTVRHRFYPPDVTQNAEMTPAELSRLFVTGHAASLVAAAAVAGKSADPKFVEANARQQAAAKAALEAIKGQVPEAAALLAAPTRENAVKLTAAIREKDLSAQVGSMLPAKGSYK